MRTRRSGSPASATISAARRSRTPSTEITGKGWGLCELVEVTESLAEVFQRHAEEAEEAVE